MERTTFEVVGSAGRPVRAVAHGAQGAPVVLVAHGFKGFKDWGMFPWICERIADAGLRAVRFDFSHNGVEARDFDRLDLFLLDTQSRHQEDLRALAGAFDGPFGIVGHSRGGADAVLFAASEPRVACVVALAAPSTTAVDFSHLEPELRERGYYPVPNARTGQTMPVARTAFEDALTHSVETAARSLSCPALFVHGESDETVPAESLRDYAAWVPQAEILELAGAGHTFGAVHPFQGPTPALERATDRIVAFTARALLR